jgi:2-Cys peroxiredoxin 5
MFPVTCTLNIFLTFFFTEDLKAAGVDEVLVYCVNDSAVMQAWSADQKTGGTFINMMGDPGAELTAALDMEMTHEGPPSVGIIGRCKRFAMYVDDSEVKFVAVSEGEDDPAGDSDPSATLAGALLEAVKASLIKA